MSLRHLASNHSPALRYKSLKYTKYSCVLRLDLTKICLPSALAAFNHRLPLPACRTRQDKNRPVFEILYQTPTQMTMTNIAFRNKAEAGNKTGNPHGKPFLEKILVKKDWHFSPFCCIIGLREY